jgi:hypothetical protein
MADAPSLAGNNGRYRIASLCAGPCVNIWDMAVYSKIPRGLAPLIRARSANLGIFDRSIQKDRKR